MEVNNLYLELDERNWMDWNKVVDKLVVEIVKVVIDSYEDRSEKAMEIMKTSQQAN